MRIDILRRDRQRLVGPGQRLLGSAEGQERLSRLQLRGRIFGEQVSGPDELRQCGCAVALRFVQFRELQPRRRQTRVLLDGVAILEDRCGQVALGHLRVAAIDVVLRAPRAPGDRHREHGRTETLPHRQSVLHVPRLQRAGYHGGRCRKCLQFERMSEADGRPAVESRSSEKARVRRRF